MKRFIPSSIHFNCTGSLYRCMNLTVNLYQIPTLKTLSFLCVLILNTAAFRAAQAQAGQCQDYQQCVNSFSSKDGVEKGTAAEFLEGQLRSDCYAALVGKATSLCGSPEIVEVPSAAGRLTQEQRSERVPIKPKKKWVLGGRANEIAFETRYRAEGYHVEKTDKMRPNPNPVTQILSSNEYQYIVYKQYKTITTNHWVLTGGSFCTTKCQLSPRVVSPPSPNPTPKPIPTFGKVGAMSLIEDSLAGGEPVGAEITIGNETFSLDANELYELLFMGNDSEG